jgi:hypothetical protein
VEPALTVLRDFSLGALAVVGMLWLLQKVIAWQQEERKAWTAKVEDWGQTNKDDKMAMAKVLEAAAISIQRMTDKYDDRETAAAASATALAATLEKIGVNMDRVASPLATLTTAIEAQDAVRKTDSVATASAIDLVHQSVLAVHDDVKRHRRAMEKKTKAE